LIRCISDICIQGGGSNDNPDVTVDGLYYYDCEFEKLTTSSVNGLPTHLDYETTYDLKNQPKLDISCEMIINEYKFLYNLSEITEIISILPSPSFTSFISSSHFSKSNDFSQSESFVIPFPSKSTGFSQNEPLVVSHTSKSNSKSIIIGTSITGGIIFLVIIAFIAYKCYPKRSESNDPYFVEDNHDEEI
jgi:hypothetical protein